MNYPAMVSGSACIYLRSIDYILLNPISYLYYSYANHMRLLRIQSTAYILYSPNVLIVYRLSQYQIAGLSTSTYRPILNR